MIRHYFHTFLVISFIAFLFSSCQKEYSYDGGNIIVTPPGTSGSAEFNFSGAPGNCTTPIISGTYKQGIATGDTNTISAQVNVTDTGSYSITTGSVNNITFSATGAFTANGLETVIFKASGIPAAGGAFNFTLGTGGCGFTINVIPGAIVPPVTSGECKDCIYIPVCVGSKYEFTDSINGGAATRYIEYMASSDTTIDGKFYKAITDNAGMTNYFNCTNGETTLAAYDVTSVNGNVLEKFESIMLKANAAVGASWESNVVNPLGQTVKQKFKITEKGIALSAGGFNFSDVIHVVLETGMDVPVVGFMIVAKTDYYYAKGVGLVLSITKDATTGTEFSRSIIKSYFIP